MPADFERALQNFRHHYQTKPQRVLCSPDVLERYCTLFEPSQAASHCDEIRHEGVPLQAAVLPPGTIAFEGEVDKARMGDW